MSLFFSLSLFVLLALSYFGAVGIDACERLFNALSRRLFVEPVLWKPNWRAFWIYPFVGFFWIVSTRSGRRSFIAAGVKSYAIQRTGHDLDPEAVREIHLAADSWEMLHVLNDARETKKR